MIELLKSTGRGFWYALFAVLLALFSVYPAYSPVPDDMALITLSLAHAGQRTEKCRERSAEELAGLPPNMRAPLDCSRARQPVAVRMRIDGEIRYDRRIEPSGLSRDGASYVYSKMHIVPGRHRIEVELDDSGDQAEAVRRHAEDLDIAPYQNIVIEFNQTTGFVIHH